MISKYKKTGILKNLTAAPRGQEGLASIVIVGVLVILLALITLGFSKIMNRAVNNSLNNQLSAAANYAAQSGINDAMAYIKGQSNPDDVSSSDCTTLLKEPGLSSLIDLSGDGNTKITCLLVNPHPADLMYQRLAPDGSQIVKATTSDAVDKMMFSWQASNGTNNALPSATNFTDVSSWNCPLKSGVPDCNAGNAPVLRIGLYPVPPDGKIAGIQANSRTFFLVPGNSAGAVTTIPYSTTDGSVIQVACNARNTGISDFTADYTCNAIVSGLYAGIAPNSYYYMTLTPIYNQADIKVKALNSLGQAVNFVDVQTVIDATAKANNAKKRLQERVDSNTTGDNIAASDNAAPDFAIRSEKALCKQIELHKSYYDYILNNAPNTCNSGASTDQLVPPTLTLSITGNNGADSGTTRDSGTATPGGSGYSGAVYIDSAATVNWRSTDSATWCNASGGWSGDKNPASSWSGVTGTGSQPFTGITNYTTYSMQCKGPGGTTPTRTVTAWPRPRVSISGPSSVHAGGSYTIKWQAYNSTTCTMSSNGNADWDQTYNNLNPTGSGANDSKSFGIRWDDHSAKIYTIQCSDPSGRSDSATWKVNEGSGGNTTIVGPACSATAKFSGNTTDDASITWNASCAGVPTNLYDVYIDTNVDGIGPGLNTVDGGGAGSVRITRADDYHFQIYIWTPGWHTQTDAAAYTATTGDGEANSGQQSQVIEAPIKEVKFWVKAWDQGPECSSPGNWFDQTWWCRNGRTPTNPPDKSPGCADGIHRYTVCSGGSSNPSSVDGIYWEVSGGNNVSCKINGAGYPVFQKGGSSGTGSQNYGWGGSNGGGSPYPFILTCSDKYQNPDPWTYNG